MILKDKVSRLRESNKQRYSTKIIFISVSIILLALSLALLYFRSYLSESQIRIIAAQNAKKYCQKNRIASTNECDDISLTHVEGPIDYSPVDGPCDYYGNWLISYETSSKAKIFVALDFQGGVQYINATGVQERPYEKSGYQSHGEHIDCPK